MSYTYTTERCRNVKGRDIVRLDEPATYLHADGETEELAEVPEGIDNLIILPD